MSQDRFSERPRGPIWLADVRTESTFEEIPVIDITAAFTKDHLARRELSDRILDAAINVGFFYIKNHGIPEQVIQDAVSAGQTLFSLPTAKKMEIDIHKTPSYKGYTALLAENTDVTGNGDLHEGFDLGWEARSESQTNLAQQSGETATAMDGANVWPAGLSNFKEPVLHYYHAAYSLGQSLFPIFALALQLQDNWFDDKTTTPAAIMRLLHYPPQDPTKIDEKEIGIGTHTDYECFTILWQDPSGGLQVQNASGKWIDAVPIPGTLVVNLGDQFARWTNNVFKSTPHRVINRSGKERYSIPVFFGTNYDVPLTPIHTCIMPDSPPLFEVMTAGDYVKSRLDATYASSTAPPID